MAEKRRGRPPKLGDHQPYVLRLPRNLHRQIRQHAIDYRCSMNDLLVAVVGGWWNRKLRFADPPKARGKGSAALAAYVASEAASSPRRRIPRVPAE